MGRPDLADAGAGGVTDTETTGAVALEGLASLADLIERRAAEAPRRPAYRFVEEADAPAVPLGMAQLHRLALGVAADLQAHHRRGDRVVLLLPPGRAFVIGFFGAVLSGLVPVPAPAPSPVRLAKGLPAMRRVVQDSRAAAVLTTAAITDALASDPDAASELAGVRAHALEGATRCPADRWVDPGLTPADLAFLQYTSGSTSDPRGVVATQASVLANLGAIHEAFQFTEASRLVTWLPPHHDMGLVGGLLAPLWSAYEAVVLTPNDFVQAPIRWLRAITEHRATVSGGPDFAYRHCIERIRDDQLDGIDLSSWQTAFTGAEPISPETITAFNDRFAGVGFRRSAFYPCYGLAESTLMVTGGVAFTGPATRSWSRRGLHEEGRAVPPADPADRRTLVSCGAPVGTGTEVAIVGPDDGAVRAPGEVGEIWVRGPAVAAGYFQRPEETAATFAARLPDGNGPYLRTGDLGLLADGDLYVTGRLKDVIMRAAPTSPTTSSASSGTSRSSARASAAS